MSNAGSTDHRERIAEALEEHRADIERVAQTETEFAKRAAAALEWLAEQTEDESDEE